MLVSMNWLKYYVDLSDIDIKTFCDGMIMSGSNLDTYESQCHDVKGVVLGKVLKVEKHKDADKLKVCQVDIGDKKIQIVTGAPNVRENVYVPVATVGSVLPSENGEQIHIKEGNLRGELSQGMMCGVSELGFKDKVVPLAVKDGLWILEGDYQSELGKDFIETLSLKDYVIDFEITSNRPDCLSILGMAKEAKATFNREIKYPTCEFSCIDEKTEDNIQVEVKSELCNRYTARVIKDVKIEQSPLWMQKRLMSAGMRPINNIVDITNFVMLEYGQPLHAFDIEQIEGRKIVVENAKAGEIFTTLDGTERTLDEDMLLIKDGAKAVAIAGVMGGLNSEITESTKTILLESANFDKTSVRLTSKRLGLRTESSSRYEKGIDPNLCSIASNRFCQLIEELGAGKVMSGMVDVYTNEYQVPTITVRVSRINKVIGTDLSRDEMVSILNRLDIKVEGNGDEMIVTPPSVRGDLLKEVDYIEEIARIYGYNNIPMTFPKEVTVEIKNNSWDFREKARNILCGLGVSEIQTFSFMNEKTLDDMRIDEDSWERSLVRLINPMGEDTASMRSMLSGGMLEVLSRNKARNTGEMRAFELGNTFTKNFVDENELPYETINLSLGMYGEDEDFFTMKGVVEELLTSLGFDKVIYEKEDSYGLYHPGRCARVILDITDYTQKDRQARAKELETVVNGIRQTISDEEATMFEEMINAVSSEDDNLVEIGIMGEVHPDVCENFDIDGRVYMGEFIFDLLCELPRKDIHYKPLAKFPAMTRDIALVVDEDVLVGQLKELVEKYPSEIIEKAEIFDIYRGRQLGDDKKSVAISITYRHKEKTLTDEETTKVHNEILALLEKEFNAVLREM